MLPPKVTVTIPAIRERRYVRKEDGPAPAPPPGPPPQGLNRPATTATARQRIYIGKPGAEGASPATAPVPASIAPVAPAPPLPAAVAQPEALPPSVPVLMGAGEEIRVSAYTEEEARVLGTPRGLLPFSALEGLAPETLTPEAEAAEGEEESSREVAELLRQPPAAATTAEADPDPVLDEVIEGLRGRIADLRAARSGGASEPGTFAAPPANPAASLWRPERRPKSKVFGLLGFVLLILVTAAFGFGGLHFHKLMDNSAAPAPAPDSPPPAEGAAKPAPAAVAATPGRSAGPLWQEADLPRLDAILSAERALSIEEMGRLLGQLQSERPGYPGLEMLAARQAQLARRWAEAEVRLSRLSTENAEIDNELTAELAFLRARNYAAQRKLLEARNCLDEAIRRDPRRPEFHYEQAELNRRMGRVGDAMAGFDRALARSASGRVPSRTTIDFRRRLMLVETGREAEIGSETYLEELNKANPSGEWVLTAAAVSLHRGQFAAGAQWMQRARGLMQPNAYLAAIEDYFFRAHAGRPELKDCFPTAAERAQFILKSLPFLADP